MDTNKGGVRKMVQGSPVGQTVVPAAKTRTVMENTWEPPNGTDRHYPARTARDAIVGEWFAVLGRLTDVNGNPVKGRGCALDVIDPNGVKSTYHPSPDYPQMTTDSNGLLRRTVHLNIEGIWTAYWWFGGDGTYEGCEGEQTGVAGSPQAQLLSPAEVAARSYLATKGVL